MAIGETILKVTGFPFAYSFMVILFRMFGWSIDSNDYIPFLIVTGTVGTFLSIIDPIGKLVSAILYIQAMRLYKDLKEEIDKGISSYEHLETTFKDNTIKTEVGKTVGIIYFLILIVLFLIAIFSSSFLETAFSELIDEEKCDKNCIQANASILIVAGIIVLGIIIKKNGRTLLGNVLIVNYYQFCVYSDNCLTSTIENYGRAIESGNWGTAQKWGGKAQIEWENEASFHEERRERVKQHIFELLTQFAELKNSQRQSIQDTQMNFSSVYIRFEDVEETIRGFPLAKNLLSHFWTDPKNQKLFNEFANCAELKKNLKEINNSLGKKIDENIKKLERKLAGNGFELDGNKLKKDKQYVHMILLKEGMKIWWNKNYQEHPIKRERGDEPQLCYIIFGTRNDVASFDDENYELFTSEIKIIKNDLSGELEDIIQTNSEIDSSLQKLETGVNFLLSANKVLGEPLDGFCEICNIPKFRSRKYRDSKRKIFTEIDWVKLGL